MSKEPKINIYQCQYGCLNVTVDVDEGVTPFMIGCEFTGRIDRPLNPFFAKDGKCIGNATSCFYPTGPKPSNIGEPTHEWYKPEKKEYEKLHKLEIEHVERGGLLLRPRTDKEPIYHGEDG